MRLPDALTKDRPSVPQADDLSGYEQRSLTPARSTVPESRHS